MKEVETEYSNIIKTLFSLDSIELKNEEEYSEKKISKEEKERKINGNNYKEIRTIKEENSFQIRQHIINKIIKTPNVLNKMIQSNNYLPKKDYLWNLESKHNKTNSYTK